MASNNFGEDLGEQIRQSVNASANWVNDLIDEIRAGVTDAQLHTQSPEMRAQRAQVLRQRAEQQRIRQQQLQENTRRRNEINARIKQVSGSGNTMRTIGHVFLGFFVLGGLSSLFDGWFELMDMIMLAAFAIPTFLTGRKIRRLKRYQKYLRIIGDRTYVELREFEENLGYSHSRVLKDLRGMIAEGYLKQGHVDHLEQNVILTNELYKQYVDAERGYAARVEKEETEKAQAAYTGKDPELVKTLNQGKQYLHEIRTANELIPGVEITKKIDRLEATAGMIFKVVEEHPEKLPEIHKFMDYYMPTVVKLLNSYHEFDMQPVQGENIKKAKNEIEDTLDMINLAFENLANRLYEDVTMDVSSDISVLKTILAQEGLKDNDFKI